MITSKVNARVKQAAALGKKSKYRNETGLFVVEGPRMFEELKSQKERIECVYVTEKYLKENAESLQGVSNVETVTDEVLKAMSDTQTPQGVLALVKQYKYQLNDILKSPKTAHLIILETIQDPGNLGTILRAGEGAGVTGVIMDAHTVDIYSSKVIRSTMGAVFRVPFVRTEDLLGTLKELKKAGVHLVAAHLQGSHDYDLEDYTVPTGFLIGNEAAGLSREIADMADVRVKIPMEGNVESLNAAVASSILMYEAARQKRQAAGHILQ